MFTCGLHRKVEIEPIERLTTGLPAEGYAYCTSLRARASQADGMVF